MYALVALLSTIVTATFVVTFVQGRRAWLPVFSVSLALIAYAHNWGLFLAIGTVAALVPIWRQAADRRAVRARRAAGLRAHRGALPAVAADPDLAGPAHRRAVGGAPDLPGHPQRPRQPAAAAPRRRWPSRSARASG